MVCEITSSTVMSGPSGRQRVDMWGTLCGRNNSHGELVNQHALAWTKKLEYVIYTLSVWIGLSHSDIAVVC